MAREEMTNSRAKGNRGEREVLKILKSHFGGEPWERKSMGIPGPDLLTPNEFPYAVEVKFNKSIKLIHFFKENKQLKDWWKQTQEQAFALNKTPLLIVKVEGIWFAISREFLSTTFWKTLESWCVETKLHST